MARRVTAAGPRGAGPGGRGAGAAADGGGGKSAARRARRGRGRLQKAAWIAAALLPARRGPALRPRPRPDPHSTAGASRAASAGICVLLPTGEHQGSKAQKLPPYRSKLGDRAPTGLGPFPGCWVSSPRSGWTRHPTLRAHSISPGETARKDGPALKELQSAQEGRQGTEKQADLQVSKLQFPAEDTEAVSKGEQTHGSTEDTEQQMKKTYPKC